MSEKYLIGNAIVGQSGGPTAAINATLAGVILGADDAKKKGIIDTLYGMKNGIEGFLCENIVNLSEIFNNERDVNRLIHTPSAALGSCRKKLPKPGENDEIYDKLLALFRKYNIRYFFYIGGNDSMDTVAKLEKYMAEKSYEMRIIGIPKTIDNDLDVTDHTPGFGSAAKYIATTVSEILCDCAVYTVPAVTIVEIMGRDAGWLTACASLANTDKRSVDYVYLPEVAFDTQSFLEDVKAALKRHPNVVMAISEGIRFADNEYVGASAKKDVFGHKQLSGAGKVLESLVKENIGCKVRSVELNISQRCAAHIASLTDINESVDIGKNALAYALDGVSGHMMIIRRVSGAGAYKTEISSSPVSEIANKVKSVPLDFINGRGNNVTKKCTEYLRPLIMGEAYPEYENGIPAHFVII
ncbi:MAG: 6-phosphofructokinase [Eubacteriales bacterium]|nr:6-phosphofructokinase [Eubacteriales bacterium]